MSALAERLAGLRRQAGIIATPVHRHAALSPSPREIPCGPVPESIRRMLGIRSRANGIGTPARPRAPDRELPGVELAPGLRLVERRYAREEAPLQCDLRFVGPAFESCAPIAASRLLHVDTETTGLAGGTGTRAFMIGAADWQGEVLRVRQLFIGSMGAEAAMLECFAGWLGPDTTLVSYNGRCYDAPLLATRYRLARMDNPLDGLAHADLLFPTRRRFRGVWENCRLATIERRWLGVEREDDLPGAQAPRAWLDYLRGGDARDLRRVVAHNDQDLRSLAELCLRLSAPDGLASVELATRAGAEHQPTHAGQDEQAEDLRAAGAEA
jgi:uncharacterized protein YprB with RNaseH-like and TPR domain